MFLDIARETLSKKSFPFIIKRRKKNDGKQFSQFTCSTLLSSLLARLNEKDERHVSFMTHYLLTTTK